MLGSELDIGKLSERVCIDVSITWCRLLKGFLKLCSPVVVRGCCLDRNARSALAEQVEPDGSKVESAEEGRVAALNEALG